jgi:hypothetical protein
MSHRVTSKTCIKNKALAISALKIAGMSYQEQGNSLQITSGKARRAVINLTTGDITGDSDLHSVDTLGALRQNYSEAEVIQTNMVQGHSKESREVMQDGRVRLVYTGMFGD